MRAVAGRPTRVRFRLEDETGTLVAADPSTTVAVTVLDGSGVQIATDTAVQDGASIGIYAYTLAAAAQLDQVTVTFTATMAGAQVVYSEPVQMVDRRIVPLSVYKADPILGSLSLLDFLRTIDQAEDAITSALNFSPVVAGLRTTWRSKECVRLFVPGIYYPQAVYSLTRNGEDQLAAPTFAQAVQVRDGAIERGWGYNFGTGFYDPLLGVYAVPWLPGVYQAWMTHGWTSTPADLAKATLMLARHLGSLAASAYPDRATRIMTEQSEIWLSTPNGADRIFGLPEVDGVVNRYRITELVPLDRGAF